MGEGYDGSSVSVAGVSAGRREQETVPFDVEHASVFDVYDELLVPLCFQAYADDLVTQLADVATGSVLEVATGTGVATRALAAALPPPVAITATDLIPGMVERARRVGTARPITWDTADAAALPYDDESFDVVVCQFGAMFFPSKSAAFAEAARVLRPGGRLRVATWDRTAANDFGDVVASSMTELFPDDPPMFLERAPYSYHDPDAIAADLLAGGLTSVRVESVAHPSHAATPQIVARAFCAGTPLRDQLEVAGSGRLATAIDGAARAVAARFGTTDLVGRSAALVATAAKG